jgi:NDP-sugar pyrophosphorylase family protein
MVEGREPLYGHFDGGYWIDTGRPSLYLAANRHVLEGRVDWEPRGTRAEDLLWEGERVRREGVATIQPAALGDDVELSQGAQLFGRTVVGDRVRVAAGAQLEGCVLFDDVTIGADAEVIGSIVCAGATIGDGAILHDAIVGAGAQVGQGNELRGARLGGGITLPPRSLIIDG